MVEEIAFEFEQQTEGGVAKDQLAVDVEDGDAGRQLIKHAAVSLCHAAELRAHGFHLGGIDRDAGAAVSARCVGDVEDASLAGNDNR